MTPQELFATQHQLWFASVFSASHVIRASRIDPYQTSSRDSAALYSKLVRLDSGQSLTSQMITDLRGAGLIERVAGGAVMTAFGQRVLRDWRRLGIASTDPAFEVARAVTLIRAGLDDEVPVYLEIYARWVALVALRPPAYWLASKWRVTLPEYLNQERSGFNPFAIIAASNDGDVGDQSDWEQWAAADPSMQPQITAMISKIDLRSGRLEFCQALELIRLSETDPDAIVPVLTSWSI